MRKFLIVLVAVGMLILPLCTYAQPDDTGFDVLSEAAVLADASSGKIFFDKNGSARLPIASVTKVMTLNLIFEAVEDGCLSLDEKITVSQNAAGMGGSQAYIDAGYDYPACELIKSIIIASANDSAVAMAERIAGSEETFVVKMNRKAEQLGMSDTVFKNCTGLPEEGHLSTARDVVKMSAELLKHEDYFKWSNEWMDEIRHEKDGRVTQLVNTNKLIRSLNGCDGLKTGSTSEAGFCITATAKRGDMRLISVILGGNTSTERFNDAARLLNYGFANLEMRKVASAGEYIADIPVKGGKDKFIGVSAAQGYGICVKNDGSENVETNIELPESVNAPVEIGQIIGKMTVTVNGEVQKEIDLIAENTCAKATLFDRIKSILSFLKRN